MINVGERVFVFRWYEGTSTDLFDFNIATATVLNKPLGRGLYEVTWGENTLRVSEDWVFASMDEAKKYAKNFIEKKRKLFLSCFNEMLRRLS